MIGIQNNIKIVAKNPHVFVEWVIRQPVIRRLVSDKMAISIMYRLKFHKKMDWNNPKTFYEKLLMIVER